MPVNETIFDTVDGLDRFSRCLSAAVKSVKNSAVITTNSAYQADQLGMEIGHAYYGRYFGQPNSYWTGLDITPGKCRLVFMINNPTPPDINLQGRTFSHFKIENHSPENVCLVLESAEFDRLAESFLPDYERAAIFRNFLEEVKIIVG